MWELGLQLRKKSSSSVTENSFSVVRFCTPSCFHSMMLLVWLLGSSLICLVVFCCHLMLNWNWSNFLLWAICGKGIGQELCPAAVGANLGMKPEDRKMRTFWVCGPVNLPVCFFLPSSVIILITKHPAYHCCFYLLSSQLEYVGWTTLEESASTKMDNAGKKKTGIRKAWKKRKD